MPELPEVETVKTVLKSHIVGRKITAVTVRNGAVVARPTADEFAARLCGQTCSDFTRRGKFLTLHFESGDTVVLHLRMTGCLTITPLDAPCEKHTHVCLRLDDGNEIRYEDTRRFGRFWYIENGSDDVYSGKACLGVEPFSVTVDGLRRCYSSSKKPLKELLLDQSLVAGIGNIYADEICFAAGLRPDKAGNRLSDAELERLCATIPEQLRTFIEKNAISFEAYNETKGRDYRNTPYLQVYGRAGKPCAVCGRPLCVAKIGGRTTVYCPHCQQ